MRRLGNIPPVILISILLIFLISAGFLTVESWKPSAAKTWLKLTSNDYYLAGTFTADQPAADETSLDNIAKEYHAEITVLTSFPGSFSIYPLSSGNCQKARKSLESVKYIARLEDCRKKTTSSNPNEIDSHSK